MKLKLFSLLALCMSLFTNLHAQPPDTYGHDIPVQLRRLIPLLLSVATSHWKEEVIPLFPNDSLSIHIDNDS